MPVMIWQNREERIAHRLVSEHIPTKYRGLVLSDWTSHVYVFLCEFVNWYCVHREGGR